MDVPYKRSMGAYVWIGVGGGRRGAVEPARHGDGRRGFDVVEAITGSGNWGVDGDPAGRVAWARISR